VTVSRSCSVARRRGLRTCPVPPGKSTDRIPWTVCFSRDECCDIATRHCGSRHRHQACTYTGRYDGIIEESCVQFGLNGFGKYSDDWVDRGLLAVWPNYCYYWICCTASDVQHVDPGISTLVPRDRYRVLARHAFSREVSSKPSQSSQHHIGILCSTTTAAPVWTQPSGSESAEA
jgi:hypothetical protein